MGKGLMNQRIWCLPVALTDIFSLAISYSVVYHTLSYPHSLPPLEEFWAIAQKKEEMQKKIKELERMLRDTRDNQQQSAHEQVM